jgi:predicted Zn-dependent protease with MMP-like domain
VSVHVSKQRFAELVGQALADLPEPFASHLEELRVEVRWAPSVKQLRHLGLEDDQLLFGLYEGISLPHRSVEHSGTMPEVIYIFQEDHELVAESEEDLVREVRTTVLHELGHHYGMSEDDLDKLGYG